MHRNGSFAAPPTFDRLKYFYGQLLGARDFQIEQSYFREKLKLHNRCLHGYGVVCGLELTADPPRWPCLPVPVRESAEREEVPEPAAEQSGAEVSGPEQSGAEPPGGAQSGAEQPEAKQSRAQAATPAPAAGHDPATTSGTVTLHPGVALDCEGNEIVVRAACSFDPWNLLSASDRGRAEKGPGTLFVSICYQEQPIEPTRPAITDSCGAVGSCTYGKLRDAWCLHVSTEPPPKDERCESCCGACEDCCLLIAEIKKYEHGHPIEASQIDTAVRREVGPRVPTAIVGVSWSHGGHYTPGQAARILGTNDHHGGLEIRFSQPVYAETLLDPVVQIYVTERGRGRSTDVYEMQGTYVEKPKRGLVKSVRYRETTGETLQHGDLVVITLRAPMVLDRCCQPVEGLNVGGRVPLLPEYHEFRSGHEPDVCVSPPFRAGPWITHGPGNFESWFTIANGESK